MSLIPPNCGSTTRCASCSGSYDRLCRTNIWELSVTTNYKKCILVWVLKEYLHVSKKHSRFQKKKQKNKTHCQHNRHSPYPRGALSLLIDLIGNDEVEHSEWTGTIIEIAACLSSITVGQSNRSVVSIHYFWLILPPTLIVLKTFKFLASLSIKVILS